MTSNGARTCNRPGWSSRTFAPTIYTTPTRERGARTFIGNFSYPDTAWPESISDRFATGDIRAFREFVAENVRQLEASSLRSLDVDRAIAETSIRIAAEAVPSILYYPIIHVALTLEDFCLLEQAASAQPETNLVQLAEDIPGISETPVTIFYSGTDVQQAFRVFERVQELAASIFPAPGEE
jgi:hypothetical protein